MIRLLLQPNQELLMNSELFYIIIPLVASLAVSFGLGVLSRCLCGTEEKKIRSSHFISGLFIIIGVAITGVGIYIFGNEGVYGNLLSQPANIALVCFGIAIFMQGVSTSES